MAWYSFTIERSPNGTENFNNDIITARTSMLDAGSALLSKACAAQSNILFPHIEDASENKSDARERLLVCELLDPNCTFLNYNVFTSKRCVRSNAL